MSAWEQYKQTRVGTLWSAARDNDVEGMRRLIDAGAPIDARDARGYSPLMLAAYAGNVEGFALLLGAGADVDSADLAGNSVLMGAAFKGHLGMVEALLDAGADAAARNQAGLDARAFALAFGRSEVVALLDQFGQFATDS